MSVTKKQVDLVRQTILTSIPIVITQIYAFHKIKKTKQGIAIFGILHGFPISWITFFTFYNRFTLHADQGFMADVNATLDSLLMFYGGFVYPPLMGFAILIYIIIPVYFVRRWTRQYNSKLSAEST